MNARLPLLLLLTTLLPLTMADAGEIVRRSFSNSKGETLSGYVYQAGKSRRSYSRSSLVERYPAFRSYGYTYPLRRPACRPVYPVCRPVSVVKRAVRAHRPVVRPQTALAPKGQQRSKR